MLPILLAAAAVATGAWHVTDKTSQLDGARTYYALLQSEGVVANIINQSERPVLGLDCSKGALTVDIMWPDFIQEDPDDSRVIVGWKFDGGQVNRSNWTASTQMVAIRGRDAVRMLQLIGSAKKLVVQVPDHHGGQDATFDLEGVGDVAATISAMRCG